MKCIYVQDCCAVANLSGQISVPSENKVYLNIKVTNMHCPKYSKKLLQWAKKTASGCYVTQYYQCVAIFKGIVGEWLSKSELARLTIDDQSHLRVLEQDTFNSSQST